MRKRRNRRARKSKKYAERLHAQRKARERYGLNLSGKDLGRIVYQIQLQDQAWFCKRQSHRVARWLVEYDGQLLPVVYDKNRHMVITFPPPAAIPQYKELAGLS